MSTAAPKVPRADDVSDAIVVGAGPVGAFLALRLAAAGLAVRVFEKRTAISPRSRAIGIMPPTLRRFAPLGLDAEVAARGVRVRRAVIHDERSALGELDFTTLPPPYGFVLSLPQGDLMAALWERLAAAPRLVFATGAVVESVAPDGDAAVECRVTEGGGTRLFRARYAVLCDGAHSALRAQLDAESPTRRYSPRFAMGDAPDGTDWRDEAHLFFTPFGSLESFPLPGGLRRWVALLRPGGPEDPAAALDARIERLTGGAGRAGEWRDLSVFAPERRLAPRFRRGRALLSGDSAHVMSPIGGQGMNTGLADADHLADALTAILRAGASPDVELSRYERERRRVFRRAAARAARGMWLGTRTGHVASRLRSAFIRALLARPQRQPALARYFAMWSLPDAAPLLRPPRACAVELTP